MQNMSQCSIFRIIIPYQARRETMDHDTFVKIRKELHKTQKEISILLGISLKAVCSYEQNWRSVPVHVERQLIFLLARKKNRARKTDNCWDIRQCPQVKKERCPAWEFDSGQFCWFINGTICDNTIHSSWQEKMKLCRKCPVMEENT